MQTRMRIATASFAVAVSLLLVLIAALTFAPNPLLKNSPWIEIQSVSVVHLPFVDYDEVLVIFRIHNPTHGNHTLSLERATLTATFESGATRSITSSAESFRFASKPPGHIVQLEPCTSTDAGLLFQGRFGLNMTGVPNLATNLIIAIAARLDEKNVLYERRFAANLLPDPRSGSMSTSTSKSQPGRESECTIPWLGLSLF